MSLGSVKGKPRSSRPTGSSSAGETGGDADGWEAGSGAHHAIASSLGLTDGCRLATNRRVQQDVQAHFRHDLSNRSETSSALSEGITGTPGSLRLVGNVSGLFEPRLLSALCVEASFENLSRRPHRRSGGWLGGYVRQVRVLNFMGDPRRRLPVVSPGREAPRRRFFGAPRASSLLWLRPSASAASEFSEGFF